MPFSPSHIRAVHLAGILHGMRRQYGELTPEMRQDAEARADRAVRMGAALEDELLKMKAEARARRARAEAPFALAAE